MNNTPNVPMHILVVEDNQMNQRLIQVILEKGGHKLTLANDGNEALKLFATQDFDAILMDCQMPNKNGFQATEEIRLIEKSRNSSPIPILALTANSMIGDKEKCLAAGMNDFLAKPFQMKTLLEKLDQLKSNMKKAG